MKKISTLVVAVGLAASTAFGAMLDQGTRELSVSGNWNRDTLAGNISFGQFVADGLILGVSVGGSYNDFGRDTDFRTFSSMLYTQYHIDIGSPVVPFVGLGGGMIYGRLKSGSRTDSETSWLGEVQAGIKTFIAHNIAIALYGFYDVSNDEVFSNKDKMEKKDFGLRIGMNSYF